MKAEQGRKSRQRIVLDFEFPEFPGLRAPEAEIVRQLLRGRKEIFDWKKLFQSLEDDLIIRMQETRFNTKMQCCSLFQPAL